MARLSHPTPPDTNGILGNPAHELRLRVTAPRQQRVIQIRSDKCTIGGADDCTLRLRGRGIQPIHCLILRGERGNFVRSFSTKNRLNGQPFTDAMLQPGDRIEIGGASFEIMGNFEAPTSHPERADLPNLDLTPAFQQPVDVVSKFEGRMDRLESQLSSLQDDSSRSESPLRSRITRLAAELETERRQHAMLYESMEEERQSLAAELRTKSIELLELQRVTAALESRQSYARHLLQEASRREEQVQQQLAHERARFTERKSSLDNERNELRQQLGHQTAWRNDLETKLRSLRAAQQSTSLQQAETQQRLEEVTLQFQRERTGHTEQIGRLTQQRDELISQLETRNDQLAELETSVDQLAAEHRAATGDHDRFESRIAELTDLLEREQAEHLTQITELETQRADMREELASCTRRIAALEAELSAAEAKYQDLQAESRAKAEQLEQLAEQLQDERVRHAESNSELESQRDVIAGQLTVANTQLEDVESQLQAAQSAREEAVLQQEAKEDQVAELNELLEVERQAQLKLQDKLSATAGELADLELDLQRLKDERHESEELYQAAQAQIADLEANLEAARHSHEHLRQESETERAELNRRLDERADELEQLQEQLTELEAQRCEAQRLREEADDKVRELSGEYEREQRSYLDEIHSINAERAELRVQYEGLLERISASDQQLLEAREAIESLEKEKSAAEQQIERLTELLNRPSNNDEVCAGELQQELDLATLRHEEMTSELENAQAEITRLSVLQASEQNSRQEQVEQLEERQTELSTELEHRVRELGQLQEELNETRDARNAAEQQYLESEQQVNELTRLLEEEREHHARLAGEWESERQSLTSELDNYRGQLNDLTSQLLALQEREESEDKAQEDSSQLVSQIDDLSEQLSQLNLQHADELASWNETRNRLQGELTEREQRVQELDEALQSSRNDASEAQLLQEELRTHAEEVERSVEQLTAEMESQSREHETERDSWRAERLRLEEKIRKFEERQLLDRPTEPAEKAQVSDAPEEVVEENLATSQSLDSGFLTGESQSQQSAEWDAESEEAVLDAPATSEEDTSFSANSFGFEGLDPGHQVQEPEPEVEVADSVAAEEPQGPVSHFEPPMQESVEESGEESPGSTFVMPTNAPTSFITPEPAFPFRHSTEPEGDAGSTLQVNIEPAGEEKSDLAPLLSRPENPSVPTPGFEANSSEAGESVGDESIEDYMSRLLARVRGDEPEDATTPAPASPPPAQAPMVETPLSTSPTPLESAPTNPTLETSEEAPMKEEEFTPRSVAPELAQKMHAMRSLANESCRTAIATHAQNSWTDAAKSHLIAVAGGLTVAGAAMLYLGTDPMLSIVGVLAGAGFSTFFAVQALRMRNDLLEEFALEAAKNVENPTSEVTELDNLQHYNMALAEDIEKLESEFSLDDVDQTIESVELETPAAEKSEAATADLDESPEMRGELNLETTAER